MTTHLTSCDDCGKPIVMLQAARGPVAINQTPEIRSSILRGIDSYRGLVEELGRARLVTHVSTCAVLYNRASRW